MMRDHNIDTLPDRIFMERSPKLDERFEDLANAIILQAVHDYRQVRKAADRESRREERSIERFFRSRWFKILTDIDGEMLIKRLQEETQQL